MFLRLVLALLLLCPSIGFAQGQAGDRTSVTSRISDPDAMISRVWVSQWYRPAYSQFVGGVELSNNLAERVRNFVDGTGEFVGIRFPNSQKRLVLTTFNFSDPDLRNALIYAKKKGIGQIMFVCDYAPMLEDLSRAGITKNGEPYGWFVPKTGNEKMRPIPHMKGAAFGVVGECSESYWHRLIARFKPGEIWRRYILKQPRPFEDLKPNQDGERWMTSISTGNFVEVPVLNRVFNHEVAFSAAATEINHYVVTQIRNLARAFKEGRAISEAKMDPPLRVQAGKGFYYEVAVTRTLDNGRRYNLNLRLEEFLKYLIANADKIQKLDIRLFHYAFTHDRIAQLLRKLLETVPHSKISGIASKEFVDREGHGSISVLDGLPNSYIKIPIAPKDLPEGSDLRELVHEKLTEIEVEIDGESYTMLYVGSANLSDNSANNFEFQVVARLPSQSSVVRGHAEFCDEVTERWTREGYLLGLTESLFKNDLANFLEMSSVELEGIYPVLEALEKNKVKAAVAAIRALWKPNQSKLSSRELAVKLNKLERFLYWFIKKYNRLNGSQNLLVRIMWDAPLRIVKSKLGFSRPVINVSAMHEAFTGDVESLVERFLLKGQRRSPLKPELVSEATEAWRHAKPGRLETCARVLGFGYLFPKQND